MLVVVVVVVVVSTLGCALTRQAPAQARQFEVPICEADKLATAQLTGLSGLSAKADDAWIAVAESGYILTYAQAAGGQLCLAAHSGPLGQGADFESVARDSERGLFIGTEKRMGAGDSEQILRVDDRSQEFTTLGQIELKYARWPGIGVESNRGIEGLCTAGPWLLAASERTTQGAAGQRRAPLAVYDLELERWSAYWLPLVSAKGRSAALECREDDDGIEFWTIERTRESTHLHHGRIALGHARALGASGALAVELTGIRTWDLRPCFADASPNLEGLSFIDGQLQALNDNHYGFEHHGDTRLWPVGAWVSSGPESAGCAVELSQY